MQRRTTASSILRTVIVLSVFGAWAAYAAGTPATPATPAKGDATLGAAVFKAKACATCHKADGTGGVKLTGNPTPNWKDPKTWADPKRKDADAYLRNCITNGNSKSGMVAWGKTGQVKPADIENLIAYIHQLAGKK
jgi:mono/diheme cytochrome c family protein